MRSAGILAIIAALDSQTAFADVVRHATIPDSIRATWAASAEDCDANKSVIVLSAKTYVSSETNCTIGPVSETPGQRGPMYSTRMQCSNGTARPQRTTPNLVISPTDANHLSAGPDLDHLTTYQRCPPNKK